MSAVAYYVNQVTRTPRFIYPPLMYMRVCAADISVAEQFALHLIVVMGVGMLLTSTVYAVLAFV